MKFVDKMLGHRMNFPSGDPIVSSLLSSTSDDCSNNLAPLYSRRCKCCTQVTYVLWRERWLQELRFRDRLVVKLIDLYFGIATMDAMNSDSDDKEASEVRCVAPLFLY